MTVAIMLLLCVISCCSFVASYRAATRVLGRRARVVPEDESWLVTHDEVMRWLPDHIRRELAGGVVARFWVAQDGAELKLIYEG